MEISYSYNRSVQGVSTNMILTTRLQLAEMEFLAKTPFRSSISDYFFSIKIVEKELDKL